MSFCVARRFSRRVSIERRKDGEGETADVGIAGALLLARDAVLQIGELALDVGFHPVERGETSLEVVDAEAPKPDQGVRAFHQTLPFPSPMIFSSAE